MSASLSGVAGSSPALGSFYNFIINFFNLYGVIGNMDVLGTSAAGSSPATLKINKKNKVIFCKCIF